MTTGWLCTREDVQRAADFKSTARNDAQVDRAIEAASRSVEGLLHRSFVPTLATRTFDWPGEAPSAPWRLWLDANEVASVTALVAGGNTIAPGDYLLRPDHGPPYTHIEIDVGSSAVFTSAETWQRAISVTGLFAHSADEAPAGTLAEALDASETGIDVTDSAAIGVGSIIKINSERMTVTGKRLLDTGQNLAGGLTNTASGTTVAVADGTAFNLGETITVDAERMLIVDIAANNLIVARAWDGSTLATHSIGADIYAPRTLTVTRGALGTTAATHSTSTPITRHVVPALVRTLTIAEAVTSLAQEGAGYARVIGSGEGAMEAAGKGLATLRRDTMTAYGRKCRHRAV